MALERPGTLAAIGDTPVVRLSRLAEPGMAEIWVKLEANNPTGSFVSDDDRAAIVDLAAARGLALVVDEVFGDYAFDDARRATPPTFAGEARALTFVLSGLSKVVGLPRLKLGWIAVSGPSADVAEARARLELVADCYLSVSTPVQLAAPAILAGSARRWGRLARGPAAAMTTRTRRPLRSSRTLPGCFSAAETRRSWGGWTGRRRRRSSAPAAPAPTAARWPEAWGSRSPLRGCR